MSDTDAGDLVPAAKRFKKQDKPKEEIRLSDLPDLALLEIAKHFDLKDLLSFSHSSARVWRIVGRKSGFWSKLLQKLNFLSSPKLNSLAAHASALFPVGCDDKRKLMVYQKTLKNWKTGDITRVSSQEAHYFAARNDILLFSSVDHMGSSDDPGYATLWDFTVWGPKFAIEWQVQRDSETFLNRGFFFIFESTICFKFYESDSL